MRGGGAGMVIVSFFVGRVDGYRASAVVEASLPR